MTIIIIIIIPQKNTKKIKTLDKSRGASPNVWNPTHPTENIGQHRRLGPVAKDHFSLRKGERSFVQFGSAQTRPTEKTMLVFVVDKQTKRIIELTKDSVTKYLANLGVKLSAVIVYTSYAFWNEQLPTTEDTIAITRKTLASKDYIFRTEYLQ